jgi:hypothetical protein
MMIRSFKEDVNSILDIDSIKERKRIIIIYEHTGKAQFVRDQLCQDYDLYISNISCTLGTGYVIPRGDVLHAYNSYRGIIKFPFLENDKININATITIYQSFFVNRYSVDGNMKEPIRTSTALKGAIGKLTDEYSRKNRTYIPLIPLPIYYNDEHQKLIASDEYKDADLDDMQSLPPIFTLRQLIDDKTTILNVKLEYEFPDKFDGLYPVETDEENPEWLIFETFSMLYEVLTRTMFKGAMFIFDIENEAFNVTNIELLYTTLAKTDIKLDVRLFFEEVQERFNYFLENIAVINAINNSTQINKVHFYVGDAVCKIKVTQQYSRGKSIIQGDTRDRSKCDLEEDIISGSQY